MACISSGWHLGIVFARRRHRTLVTSLPLLLAPPTWHLVMEQPREPPAAHYPAVAANGLRCDPRASFTRGDSAPAPDSSRDTLPAALNRQS